MICLDFTFIHILTARHIIQRPMIRSEWKIAKFRCGVRNRGSGSNELEVPDIGQSEFGTVSISQVYIFVYFSCLVSLSRILLDEFGTQLNCILIFFNKYQLHNLYDIYTVKEIFYLEPRWMASCLCSPPLWVGHRWWRACQALWGEILNNF